MRNDPRMMLDLIAQTIFDKKGMNILALDVRSFSTITDYALIAEGNVDRHVTALAHAVMDALSEIGEPPLRVEGLKMGDWVVLDYGTIMVHLFMPGTRDKYHLEELWKAGEIVDCKINVNPSESIG